MGVSKCEDERQSDQENKRSRNRDVLQFQSINTEVCDLLERKKNGTSTARQCVLWICTIDLVVVQVVCKQSKGHWI